MIKIILFGHPKARGGHFAVSVEPNDMAGVGMIKTLTPISLWANMGSTEFNKGIALERWFVFDRGKKFYGTSADSGPTLSSDAEVTLYVKGADA